MSGFNRSAFKGAKLSSLKDEKTQAEEKSNINQSSGRVNFHSIESGENVFRILPPHKADEPPFRAIRTTYLNVNVPEYDDDGNATGKMQIKKKRIFIATVHGNDKDGNPMRNDPVEAYIKYAWKKANELHSDKEDRKTFMFPINGYMDKKGKYVPGISPSTNYVFYAVKNGQIGRLELYKSMLDRMEEMNASSDSDDEPLQTDIFSDPDEGVSLIITYNDKGERGKKYSITKREISKKFKTLDEFYFSERVPDDILKELQTKESLTDLFVNVYSLKDFDMAVDGLKRFDAENSNYDIFSDQEFINELEEIKESLQSSKSSKVTASPEAKESSATDTVKKMSKFDCKKYLNSYILENYGETKTLPDSLEELREWVLLAMEEKELPVEEEEGNDYNEEDNSTLNEEDDDEVASKLRELRSRV